MNQTQTSPVTYEEQTGQADAISYSSQTRVDKQPSTRITNTLQRAPNQDDDQNLLYFLSRTRQIVKQRDIKKIYQYSTAALPCIISDAIRPTHHHCGLLWVWSYQYIQLPNAPF